MADPENDHGFVYLGNDGIANIDSSLFFDLGFGDDDILEDYVTRISPILAETIDARLRINHWIQKFHPDTPLHPSHAAFRRFLYRVDPELDPPTVVVTHEDPDLQSCYLEQQSMARLLICGLLVVYLLNFCTVEQSLPGKSERISALDALNSEYFWVDPLPCDPKSLPKYESSHEFQARKKLQQQLQHEERQKLEHPQTHACLHPFQQTWQPHPPIRPDPGQPIHGAQPQISTYASHHYGKPRGPSGGWGRYRGGGNHCFGGNNPNHPHRGGQGGPYISCPYPPQGRGPSCIGSNMPGTGASRGGASFGGSYGAGGPNYPQGGPFGASGAVRGPSMGGYCNQPYNCWQ